MGGWWMGVGFLVFIGLLALLVALFKDPDPQRRESNRAAQILAERFARGEIDEPEYRSRLAALRR